MGAGSACRKQFLPSKCFLSPVLGEQQGLSISVPLPPWGPEQEGAANPCVA